MDKKVKRQTKQKSAQLAYKSDKSYRGLKL